MSPGSAFAVGLTVAAGLGGSVQAAVMGKLGARIGTIEALGFSTLVGLVAGVAAMLAARQSLDGVAAGFRQPAWLWIGGVLSAFIVLTVTYAAPRLGIAATVGVMIAGNLVMAALIDRFGWLGAEKIALHWPRLLGIALLAAGAALSLRR